MSESKKENTIERMQSFRSLLSAESVLKNVPFLLLIGILGIVYIANAHYHLQLERKIDRKEKQIQKMSWEYMTTKSDVMYKSKQSEVAKAVEPLGLKPLTEPPKIIEIEK